MFTRTPVQQQLNMQCIAASLMKLKGPCCAHNADPPLMAVRGTPDFLSNGCVKSCNLASSTAHYDQLLDRAATALCCLQSSSSYQFSTYQQTCTMLAFYEMKACDEHIPAVGPKPTQNRYKAELFLLHLLELQTRLATCQWLRTARNDKRFLTADSLQACVVSKVGIPVSKSRNFPSRLTTTKVVPAGLNSNRSFDEAFISLRP